MTATLIDAHGHPDALDDLVRLEGSLDAGLRHDPEVAASLVAALAYAEAPEAAEERLASALAVITDRPAQEDLVVACVSAYQRRALSAAIRISEIAEQAGRRVDEIERWPSDPDRLFSPPRACT